MRFEARIAVAALASAVIAWVVTAFVLHAMFAVGDYTSEALVELSPWAIWLIGGGGAMVGSVAALLGGRSPLPEWVRPAVVGSLVGVALAVVPTLFVACALAGESKGQAPYLHAGLVYAVPVGLIAGATAGLIRAKRQQAERGSTEGIVSVKTEEKRAERGAPGDQPREGS